MPTDRPGRPLRGVAIGAGYFARHHLDAWARLPQVDMLAVCDRDISRARAAASGFGIPTASDDWQRVLTELRPDFVDVITGPGSHREICRFAAERGIDVICQKPVAPDLNEAQALVAEAEAAGVRLMVHENFRWQPWYRAIRRLQDEGSVGEFTHVHVTTRLGDGWREDAYLDRQPYFREYPRLLLFETGVHFADTFRFLLGGVVSVFARTRRLNPAIQGEDAAVMMLTFESGATAVWDASRYNESEAADPRYTFGEVRVDARRGHVTLAGDGTIRVKPLGAPAYVLEYLHERRGFAGDCVLATQRHFAECLRTGAAFETDGREYLRSMAVVEAAYASAACGQAVAVES